MYVPRVCTLVLFIHLDSLADLLHLLLRQIQEMLHQISVDKPLS